MQMTSTAQATAVLVLISTAVESIPSLALKYIAERHRPTSYRSSVTNHQHRMAAADKLVQLE
jgi:hypothetical protein